ncbi:MAG: ABC transporter ATP-binding protein [Geodermatophilaceae bacterium]
MTTTTAPTRPNRRAEVAEPVVVALGLTKRYRSGVLAVDSVNLQVNRGEVYGFLGPNGAGKTTTMRMLLGLIRPTAGSVRVLGHAPGTPAGLAKVGALVESPGFYPYLSGRDNLRVLARYAGVRDTRVTEVLEIAGLSDRAGDGFGQYSLGMKQRLGVASTLLKDPELLVLDEPTNGLDPAGMADMRRLIARLRDEGRAVLLSSHLLGEVEQVCDRVGVISGGRLIAESTVAALRGQAELVVTATPLADTVRVAVGLVGESAVQQHDGTLRCQIDADRVGELNRAFVGAGIEVTELRRDERSLEEVFLTMTTQEVSDVG